ncbi:MAG: alpha/beta hydrolase [Verrucomicrobiaceae bacterium]
MRELVFALLSLLALNAVLQAKSRWRWKLRLVTLEFGHWLSLVCAGLVAWHWAFLLFVIVFLRPAWQASRIAKKHALPFSWLRLWFPRREGQNVIVTRTCAFEHDGEKIDVVVYTPAGDVADFFQKSSPQPAQARFSEKIGHPPKRRCIVALHTGGWDSGDPGEFPAANRELAARCDVVICSVGYRLAPKHPWPAQAEDTRRAIAWVRENSASLGIDADDLILLGRSAGAQIATACAFGMPELRVSTCIAVYGPPDMFFARKWSYPDDILKSLKLVQQYMGGDPEDLPEVYRTASASEFVSEDSPATLLIHGESDSLVWVEHSRRLHAKMQGLAHSSYLELPWGDHGCDYFPSSPGGQLSLAMMERFLKANAQAH